MSTVISPGQNFFGDLLVVSENQTFGSIEDGAYRVVSPTPGNDLFLQDVDSGQESWIEAGAGDDVINTGAGDDLLFGQAGDDVIFAQSGDDVARGGEGNDRIFGNGGDDLLFGGSGDDVLNGGLGDDVIKGGSGDDIIVFGRGLDRVTGGSGADRFRLEQGTQVDRIADFDPKEDLLEITRSIIPGSDLAKGELKASDFEAVETIGESDALIVYESSSGVLYYNPAGGSLVPIVQLSKDLNLSAQDIAIV